MINSVAIKFYSCGNDHVSDSPSYSTLSLSCTMLCLPQSNWCWSVFRGILTEIRPCLYIFFKKFSKFWTTQPQLSWRFQCSWTARDWFALESEVTYFSTKQMQDSHWQSSFCPTSVLQSWIGGIPPHTPSGKEKAGLSVVWFNLMIEFSSSSNCVFLMDMGTCSQRRGVGSLPHCTWITKQLSGNSCFQSILTKTIF